MKYEKLFLELLEKNKSSENFITFDWVEFLKFMQLERYAVWNIKKQIFPVLKKSKFLKQYFSNLEFETIKHKGSGNVIKEIKISFDIITENSKISNQNEKILMDTENKIFSYFQSQEIFKYIDLLNLVIKEQNINGNIFRLALKNLVDDKKLFIICLEHKWDRYVCIKNDKKAVRDFYTQKAMAQFIENDGINFLKSFCYKYDICDKSKAGRIFHKKLSRNIKVNYKLNFDSEAIQSLIGKYCLDFLRYGFNRHRAIVYFFDRSIYSRAELKEISNNAKKWKFLNF